MRPVVQLVRPRANPASMQARTQIAESTINLAVIRCCRKVGSRSGVREARLMDDHTSRTTVCQTEAQPPECPPSSGAGRSATSSCRSDRYRDAYTPGDALLHLVEVEPSFPKCSGEAFRGCLALGVRRAEPCRPRIMNALQRTRYVLAVPVSEHQVPPALVERSAVARPDPARCSWGRSWFRGLLRAETLAHVGVPRRRVRQHGSAVMEPPRILRVNSGSPAP